MGKFVRILMYLIIALVVLAILVALISKKQRSLSDYETRHLESFIMKPYEDFGYNKPFLKPVRLNFEVQEEKYSAQDEFYSYILEYINKTGDGPKKFTKDKVIAYKYDLNDDGFDEIIAQIRYSLDKKEGVIFYILMKSEVYRNLIGNKDPKSLFGKIYLEYNSACHDEYQGYLPLKASGNYYMEGLYILPNKTSGFYDYQEYFYTKVALKDKVNSENTKIVARRPHLWAPMEPDLFRYDPDRYSYHTLTIYERITFCYECNNRTRY